jgi:hypothetical protein
MVAAALLVVIGLLTIAGKLRVGAAPAVADGVNVHGCH